MIFLFSIFGSVLFALCILYAVFKITDNMDRKSQMMSDLDFALKIKNIQDQAKAIDNWIIIYGDIASKSLISRVECKRYTLDTFDYLKEEPKQLLATQDEFIFIGDQTVTRSKTSKAKAKTKTK